MSFGSCCIYDDSEYSSMNAKSVQIKGEQSGLLINFELIQTFYHTESKPQEVCYLFPNDLKLCIYDTTFVIGKEIIKPKLKPKEEAESTYEEAVEKGHTAIYGSNVKSGMTKFKLGNVPSNTDIKVILKIAFTANVTKQNSFFVKFPLDVYTPDGSKDCLDILSSDFLFQLHCDKEKIKDVKSNIKNGQYDNSQKLFTIKEKINCQDDEKSIIINFETINPIQSSVYVGQSTNDYCNCALTISPNLKVKQSDSAKEFIFVIDCSGSMEGQSIKRASECLEVFIRSLPVNSYFNIVCFGSSFNKLFESSIQYNESSIQKALNLVKGLRANLGGTELHDPLKNIFEGKNKYGQRQIFIMTDGEVWNVEKVLSLVSSNSRGNRCFTIGIGRGCDAGLVEGIAKSSGGKCDFVQEGDSISEKVIPQLQSSLFGDVNSIEIHIEGEENDAFQTSPYPLPAVNPTGSCVVYLRSKMRSKNDDKFNKNFLITGDYANESIEIPVIDVNSFTDCKEDEFGCSEGKNIGKAILPLFAFNLLGKYEKMDEDGLSDAEREKAIELSLSSGVLCKFTAFVGVSGEQCPQFLDEYEDMCDEDMCYMCCSCSRSYDAVLDDDDDDDCDMCCCECAPQPMTAHHFCAPIETGSIEQKSKSSDQSNFLMSLMRMQNFNGYWEDLDELNDLLQLNVSHIDGVNADDEKIKKNCVATLLAIAVLHTKAADEQNVWIMIEQKALSWLAKALPNADIEKLINDAKLLIK